MGPIAVTITDCNGCTGTWSGFVAANVVNGCASNWPRIANALAVLANSCALCLPMCWSAAVGCQCCSAVPTPIFTTDVAHFVHCLSLIVFYAFVSKRNKRYEK